MKAYVKGAILFTAFMLVACEEEQSVNELNAVTKEQALVKEAETQKKQVELTEVSAKDTYLEKLNATVSDVESIRNAVTSGITIELKSAEGEIYDLVDPLLNEVYAQLKLTLNSDEMNQVIIEQRKWIESRDEQALKASKEYEGGTQELLEYAIVINDLTLERTAFLINNYLK